MKTDKPMDRKDAIDLMALLAAVVMGPNQFEKASDKFKMLVFSSAGLVDAINEKGLREVLSAIDE